MQGRQPFIERQHQVARRRRQADVLVATRAHLLHAQVALGRDRDIAGRSCLFEEQAGCGFAPAVHVVKDQVAAAGNGREFVHRQAHGGHAGARHMQRAGRNGRHSSIAAQGQADGVQRSHADVAAGWHGAADAVRQARNKRRREDAPQFNPSARAQCHVGATAVDGAGRALQNMATRSQGNGAAIGGQGALPGTQIGAQQQVAGRTGGAQRDAARTGLYAHAVVERGVAAHAQAARCADIHAAARPGAQAALRQRPQRRAKTGCHHAVYAQVRHCACLQSPQRAEANVTRAGLGRHALDGQAQRAGVAGTPYAAARLHEQVSAVEVGSPRDQGIDDAPTGQQAQARTVSVQVRVGQTGIHRGQADVGASRQADVAAVAGNACAGAHGQCTGEGLQVHRSLAAQHAVCAQGDALVGQHREAALCHVDADAVADHHRAARACLQQGIAGNGDVGVHRQGVGAGAQDHRACVELFQAQGLVVEQRNVSCRIDPEAVGGDLNGFAIASQGADGAGRLQDETATLQVGPGITQAGRIQRLQDAAFKRPDIELGRAGIDRRHPHIGDRPDGDRATARSRVARQGGALLLHKAAPRGGDLHRATGVDDMRCARLPHAATGRQRQAALTQGQVLPEQQVASHCA